MVKVGGTWFIKPAEKDNKPVEELKGEKFTFTAAKVTGPDLTPTSPSTPKGR